MRDCIVSRYARQRPPRRRTMWGDAFEEESDLNALHFCAQLQEALELHSHTEEQVFYPALEEADMTAEMVQKALEDHQLVADLLEELATTPKGSAAWDEKLHILEENVGKHVKEEACDLFDAAQQLLSQEEAAELAERWQTTR